MSPWVLDSSFFNLDSLLFPNSHKLASTSAQRLHYTAPTPTMVDLNDTHAATYETTYSSCLGVHTYSPSGPLAGRWTPLRRESQSVPPPLLQTCHLLHLAVETLDVVLDVSRQSYTQSHQEELQRNINIKATSCPYFQCDYWLYIQAIHTSRQKENYLISFLNVELVRD